MAPPRKYLAEQVELLIDCLEKNRDMANSTVIAGHSKKDLNEKWKVLAKELNAVPGGPAKSADGWRRFWIEWRYKCRKKVGNIQKFQESESKWNRYLPLDELELRSLELIGPISSSLASADDPGPDPSIDSDSNSANDTKEVIPTSNIAPVPKFVPIKPKPTVNTNSSSFYNESNDTSQLEALSSGGEAWTWPSLSVGGAEPVAKPLESGRKRKSTGMEALETSINYWEDALAAFSMGARGGVSGTLALTSPEEAEFCREIQDLLQNAYMLQERCELLFLDQRSVLFRSESGGGAGGGAAEGEGRRSRLLSTHTGSSHTRREHHSSAESFASAEDQVADLREFDDFTELVPELENLELYQNALKQLDVGIPYRTLRTDVVCCGSDAEFLVKLWCVRAALRHLFRDAAVWAWFVDAGRQVLTDLLLYADKEPKEFLVAYEDMVSWATDAANWSTIESELTSKGVKALTFYDVVLDYILLDAFEDLAAPPSSVLAVVRNRWLSDHFKESALTTAVWSVIKAKRRYLQYPEGFMAHFYSISEHLLPVLVWGFLGPRERLRDVCQSFQSEIVGFITDLFSFHKCRYTTVEDLASDIMQHARARTANITDKLADRN